MAGELQADYTTGRTLYAQVRNSVGAIWNTVGVAFEAYQTANIADYDIAMTEQGTASRLYAGNMPAVAAGFYNIVVKDRAGGAPAETDTTVAAGDIEWDGSAVVALTSRATQTALDAVKTKTDFLPSATAGAAGGLFIAGSNAATTFATFTVTGAMTLTGAVTAIHASNNISGVVLSASGNNAIADALLDRADAVETGLTPREALRLMSAAMCGVLTGAGGTQVTILGAGVVTGRIVATVDDDGNRLALTLTP